MDNYIGKEKDWENMSVEDLQMMAKFRDIPNGENITDRKTLVKMCTRGKNYIIYENLPDCVLQSLLRQRNKSLSVEFSRKKAIFCLLDDDENRENHKVIQKTNDPWSLTFDEIGRELVKYNYDFSPFLINIQDCCYILYSTYLNVKK